ncbi:MAG: tetratricopeptide repeat protein [Vicinamibacterales bacterium]
MRHWIRAAAWRSTEFPLSTHLPKLTVLALCVTAGFFVTRAVAVRHRADQVADAETWYHRGTVSLQNGESDAAVAAFRRAVTARRDSIVYATAYARALGDAGQLEAASSALERVRLMSPGDAHVNLALARLAVRRGLPTEAIRLYRNALYATWPNEAERLDVRLELASFLIDEGRTADAAAELVAAAAAAPVSIDALRSIGALLLRAEDPARALEVYRSVLTRAPADQRALAGAAEAALRLGQYAAAREYYARIPEGDAATREGRAFADAVVTRDPLAPRLTLAQRRQRVAANVAAVLERLEPCAAAADSPDRVEALTRTRERLSAASRAAPRASRDELEDYVAQTAAAASLIDEVCGAPPPLHRALAAIAARHGLAP